MPRSPDAWTDVHEELESLRIRHQEASRDNDEDREFALELRIRQLQRQRTQIFYAS